jgi:uncharacterized protein YkwD
MPRPSPTRRLVLLLAVVLVLVSCAWSNPMAADDAAMVNQLRASNQVPQLPRALELDQKAQTQAQAMANAGQIFHSTNLAAGVSPGWEMIGENVAMAGSIAQAEAALEASAPHLENLLNADFTEMGIGAVQSGRYVFVCQVFVQR